MADGTETVTLLRRGRTPGDAGTVIAHALRRAITAGEAAIVNTGDVRKQVPSGGQQLADDLVWHLPVAELPDAPRLGDVILDGDGRRWTILTVKRATLGARWRCETRNLAIAVGLDDTISVQKNVGRLVLAELANVEDGHAGKNPAAEDNHQLRPPRRPRPPRSIASSSRRTSTLDHTCRIRGPDGTIYTITGTIGAEQIGELQVIEAEIRA